MDLKLDEERAVLEKMRADVMARVTAGFDNALASLDRIETGKGNGAAAQTTGNGGVSTGRRPMSAKNREAARKRMKKYWADKRRAARASK